MPNNRLSAFHICILDTTEDAADLSSRWRRLVTCGAFVSAEPADNPDIIAFIDPAAAGERSAVELALTMKRPRLVLADELLEVAERDEPVDAASIAKMDAKFRRTERRQRARTHKTYAQISTALPILKHFRI